ncbi:capsid cement protein [Terriglobus albidus]|uniref:capsid cement protein n=1 Tax=Terriglobus albidus TaxID=1592106 RepID=UPI0021E06C7D|nr:capsid cement protein [Terriglobus albidus]
MNQNTMIPKTATASVGKYRIVKPGTNNGEAVLASAATDKIVGVSDNLDVVSGDRYDVVVAGYAPVTYGGTIAAGDPLTSDANGAAVTAAPAVGSNVRLIGFAHFAGVAGDVWPIQVAPSVMQG